MPNNGIWTQKRSSSGILCLQKYLTICAASGESGGGYIVLGTMVVLATRDESHLVKAAFPIIPMISDYCFSDPEAMTLEERMTVKQVHMKILNKYE